VTPSGVALFTRLTAHPGRREAMLKALEPFLRELARDNDLLSYAMHLDDADADAVWFYTLFPSREAMARHRAREAAMTEAMGRLLGALGTPVATHGGPRAVSGQHPKDEGR
jgi:quinol monooxygenase YgiN